MQQKRAAERLSAGVGAVHNWVKAYREGGMAALQTRNRNAAQNGKWIGNGVLDGWGAGDVFLDEVGHGRNGIRHTVGLGM